MSKQISIALRSIYFGSIAAISCIGIAGVAYAQGLCVGLSSDLSARNEVDAALQVFGSRLVAVGRVDAVAAQFGVDVLGYRVQASGGDSFQVGDYAAVIDWSVKDAREQILEVRSLATRYVPGASEVYLKAFVVASDRSRSQVWLGDTVVDHSASILPTNSAASRKGALVAVRGTQPAPQGVVLGACVSIASPEGSLGTGRPDGSMGTGRPDGSMGTGKPDGSLGTGSPEASLGTVRIDGSLGTGRPDGSMGTGRPDGSLGTGRPDGSMGTGKPDGSLGTGSPEGSMGTDSSAA